MATLELLELSTSGNVEKIRQIVSSPVDIDQADTEQQTPLLMACKQAHEKIVELLIAAGADPNKRDAKGTTSLMHLSSNGLVQSASVLLISDAEVNAKNSDGKTPLMFAAYHGHKDMVHLLLAAGAEINASDANGRTALMHAAAHCHEEVAMILLSSATKLKLDAAKTEKTALHLASAKKLSKLVHALLASGIDINAVNSDGRTALMAAAANGDDAMVKVLMADHADPTVQDKNGNTALMIAAGAASTDVVDTLVAEGSSVKLKNKAGYTALMLAVAGSQDSEDEQGQLIRQTLTDLLDTSVQMVHGFADIHTALVSVAGDHSDLQDGTKIKVTGNEEKPIDETLIKVKGTQSRKTVMKKLIEFGEGVDEVSGGRQSALSIAARCEEEQLVRVLLEKGATVAEPDRTNALIMRVLRDTVQTNDMNISHPGSKPAEGLAPQPPHAEKVSNVTSRNALGQTPLIIAAAKGLEQLVVALLDDGAEMNAKDFKGFTALMMAAQTGHLKIVEIFLDHKADINSKNVQGWTPLALAAMSGHTHVVNRLIELGAHTDFKFKGMSLLMMVATKGQLDMIRLLLANGADPALKDHRGHDSANYARSAGHDDAAKALNEALLGLKKNDVKKPAVSASKRRTKW